MSNNDFKFPPPPPPPPRKLENANHTSSHKIEGGGRWNDSSTGSGRVFGRGGFSRSSDRSYLRRPNNERQSPRFNPSQKRDHRLAFSNANLQRQRPQAPPPVPSFNAHIQSLVPPKAIPTSNTRQDSKRKTQNVLGLTPVYGDPSGSESDGDEESRMASSEPSGLQFEYNGSLATLKTAADIAAWISERRKRYPTRAKTEAAKMAEVERRQRLEQEKQTKLETKRHKLHENKKSHRQVRDDPKSSNSTAMFDKERPHGVEAKKDSGKALAREISALDQTQDYEHAALKNDSSVLARNTKMIHPRDGKSAISQISKPVTEVLDDGFIHDTSDSSELTDSEMTSSSGSSSDSEDDSAPEELSSKSAGLNYSRAPQTKDTSSRPVCRALSKYGRCKYGSTCRYSHDLPARRSKRQLKTEMNSTSSKRRSLWQAMVEKEQEEERKQVLQAIIALGKSGVLEDAVQTKDP